MISKCNCKASSILFLWMIVEVLLLGPGVTVTAFEGEDATRTSTRIRTAFQIIPYTDTSYTNSRARNRSSTSCKECRLFPVTKQLHHHGEMKMRQGCNSVSIIHPYPPSTNNGVFGRFLGGPFSFRGKDRRQRQNQCNYNSIVSLIVLANASNGNSESDGDDTSSSGKNGNGGDNKDKMKKVSTARAGGRSQSRVKRKFQKQELTPEPEPDPSTNVFANIVKNALPLLLLFFIVKSLFGSLFGVDGGDYVYYQSTVYESTVYNADGQTERIRKESVRSNVPGFQPNIGERENQKERNPIMDESSYLRNLDEELNRELGTIYRENYRSTIVEDFYD